MLREVNFTGRTGRFDVPSFLFTENEELEIKFNVQVCIQGVYVATIKHGNFQRTVRLDEDKTLTIVPEWLKENGEQPIEILLELWDTSMSRRIIPSGSSGFFIEPLYMEKVDDAFTAVGWLQKIESGMEEMALQIEELQSIVERVPQHIEDAKREAIVTATGGDVMNG